MTGRGDGGWWWWGGQLQRLWSGALPAQTAIPPFDWRHKCTLFRTYISPAITAWNPAKPNFSSMPESNALFDMWRKNHRGLLQGPLNSYHSLFFAPYTRLHSYGDVYTGAIMNLKHAGSIHYQKQAGNGGRR